MPTPNPDKRFVLLVALAICAAGIVAYSNTFTAEFVWDDVSSVLLHQHVQDPSQFSQLFREDQHAFGRGQGNFYRPLVAASFMLDYALARPEGGAIDPETGIPDVSPFLFHLTNVLWHIAAALLLFGLMSRLDAPRPLRAAVPLLYVVHPLHTEAVAYISGRADSMAAAFMFAALGCALWRGSAVRRAAGALLSGLLFAAGLLSKESASIFPFLLILVVALEPYIEGERPVRAAYLRRALPVALSVVLVAAYGWLRATVLQFAPPEAAAGASFGQRVVDAGQAFAQYIRLIFVPTGLHMERTLDGAPAWTALVGYLLLAGCVALAVYGLRRGYYRLTLGIAWFLVAWFPISGLIPLNAPMAEHWMYVPLAGFLWALGELLWPRLRHAVSRQLAAVAVYAVLLAFVAVTIDRNRDWKDNEAIYLATLRYNPDSIKAQYNLAVTYEVLRDNPAGARRHYGEVLRIYDALRRESGGNLVWDQELEAHVALGNILYDQGQYDEAGRHYTAALQAAPTERNARTLASAAYGRGRVYLALGDTASAIRDFQQAVARRPDMRDRVAALLRDSFILGAS